MEAAGRLTRSVSERGRGHEAPAPSWAGRLLEGVHHATARQLFADSVMCVVPRRTQLDLDGDPGSAVRLVASGTARVHVCASDPWSGVALLGPGDVVGELIAAYSAGRPVTVTCLEETELARVPRAAFDAAARHDVAFAENLARMLSSAVAQTRALSASLRWLEVDRRVARQLLALGDRYGMAEPDGRVRIPLRLTQQDLACLSGASRERTNRALNAFRRRGWISVDRARHITLARPDLLRKRLNSRV